MPEVYEFLEAERIKYAIRLPANRVLQDRIGYLLKRPVGRPAHHVRRCHASFSYQAGSWSKPRRVIAKVEWHPEELYPRVGFIVTNMSRPAERVVAFYNKRGTCDSGRSTKSAHFRYFGRLKRLGWLGGFFWRCAGVFWGLRRVVGEPRSSGRGVFLPL
jgi:hypothetical protein